MRKARQKIVGKKIEKEALEEAAGLLMRLLPKMRQPPAEPPADTGAWALGTWNSVSHPTIVQPTIH